MIKNNSSKTILWSELWVLWFILTNKALHRLLTSIEFSGLRELYHFLEQVWFWNVCTGDCFDLFSGNVSCYLLWQNCSAFDFPSKQRYSLLFAQGPLFLRKTPPLKQSLIKKDGREHPVSLCWKQFSILRLIWEEVEGRIFTLNFKAVEHPHLYMACTSRFPTFFFLFSVYAMSTEPLKPNQSAALDNSVVSLSDLYILHWNAQHMFELL